MANIKRIILTFTDDSSMTHEEATDLCEELAEEYECECTIEGELQVWTEPNAEQAESRFNRDNKTKG